MVLDTVELVLSAAEQSPAPTPVASAATIDPAGSSDPALAAAEEEAAAAAAAAAVGGGGSSWLGSTLQSMALRAGLNVTGACWPGAASASASVLLRQTTLLACSNLSSPCCLWLV